MSVSSRPAAYPPSSTYRVQLNASFPFDDAERIVPYLRALNVGALYTSPFLTATPGSTHGYDVTDYTTINPEIGTDDDLQRLAHALANHGLGFLVDVVPNHMGIAAGANAWWQDLLENGRASPYASYFDIDWRPLKEELRGKMLLPVLGDPYGVVLERGELHLALADGAFTVHYHETPLPIAPPTYPLILTPALERLGDLDEEDPARLELASIITACQSLPESTVVDPDALTTRRHEQIVIKRRLADLMASSPEVAAAVDASIAEINGDPARPHSFDALDHLLDAQTYRLSSFRTAGEEINYRRFFAINELAAVRQEEREVFAAAHARLLHLLAEDAITGLRIDHPDGLWDPAGYFRDLQRAAYRALTNTPEDEEPNWEAIDPALGEVWAGQSGDGAGIAARLPLYVVVEKILEPGEALPQDWAVHGTVGYEFARATTGLFVDPANRRAFDQLYARFTGEQRTFAAIAYDTRDLMLRTALASETNVLARALNRISEQNRRTRDLTLSSLRHALREVIANFPIYRTYIVCNGQGVPERDRRAIERAVRDAKRRNPAMDPSVFDFLRDVLLLRDDPALGEQELAERCHFVMKFQQLTGPVMAKGVEDTAFYIYNRLIALNEVGGDPASFGSGVAEFHRQNAERANRWPFAMLTSSTHDTKRSEDVRARIAVLSEIPREWRAAITRWARLNRKHKTRLEGASAPDRNDEYLFYQTVLGAWPWGEDTLSPEVIDRVEAFMLKAVRESQVHTTWINPDPAYEEALSRFVRQTLAPGSPFLEDIAPLRDMVAHIGAFNALAQQLLKLTSPGVPDLYQGTELWDQSLVDPDNRRPVDYAARAKLLQGMQRRPNARSATSLLKKKDDGRLKLFVTMTALAERTAWKELFTEGEYLPLAADGPAADHVVAFARRHEDNEFIVVVPRLLVGLTGRELRDPIAEVWGDTRLLLPHAEEGATYQDLLTFTFHHAIPAEQGTALPLGNVFAHLPLALLHRVR
ncbi:MAG: malto-oligosyltrehalose synthase [Chloroflexia bacterium]|nr:malto-oligosyltrehalose synthase [Chloroflexia bacterium]